MKHLQGFSKGMGIGGWLTNYKRFNVLPPEWRLPITEGDMEHFRSYITPWDMENIAAMGMDHVRIGFDQIVLEEAPYQYREEVFELLHTVVDACDTVGLRVVLNLHKAVGNYCDIAEEVGLLDDEELQNRFVALWEKIEDSFAGKSTILFELLNEVRDVNPMQWNRLAERTVAALRKKNPLRPIIIGSVRYNDPGALKDLTVFNDENILYTFHTYMPFEFTHQQGVLVAPLMYYNRKMPWPGDVERYRDCRRTVWKEEAYQGYTCLDRNYIRDSLVGAKAFIDAHPDKLLWCGEFGTIRHCPIAYRENWMADVIAVLKEWDIPYSVWNYLSTPNDGNRFSLVDDDTRQILSPRLLDIINGRL